MTTEEALQAVRAYLKRLLTLTDAQVLVDGGGTVRPGSAFLSVAVVSDSPVGRPVSYLDNVPVPGNPGNIGSVAVQMRDLRVSVNGYGNAALAWMETLSIAWVNDSRYGQSTWDSAGHLLRVAGVHVYDVTPIQRRSTFLQTQIEPRWGCDLRCYVSREAIVSRGLDEATTVMLNAFLRRPPDDIVEVDAEVQEP